MNFHTWEIMFIETSFCSLVVPNTLTLKAAIFSPCTVRQHCTVTTINKRATGSLPLMVVIFYLVATWLATQKKWLVWWWLKKQRESTTAVRTGWKINRKTHLRRADWCPAPVGQSAHAQDVAPRTLRISHAHRLSRVDAPWKRSHDRVIFE